MTISLLKLDQFRQGSHEDVKGISECEGSVKGLKTVPLVSGIFYLHFYASSSVGKVASDVEERLFTAEDYNPLRRHLSSSPPSPPVASSSPSSPRAAPAEPNLGAPPDGLEFGAPLPSSPAAAALRELFFDVDHRLGEFFFDIGCL
ncbi:hypothetical protein Droror1_Dr00025839 [Drosera rotundifolia]